MRTALLLLLAFSLGTPNPAGARRPSRRSCLHACAPTIAACHDAGARRAFCRRTVVKICRKRGVDACQIVTPTTLFPPTTTTFGPSTTTTTLAIDRTVNRCSRDHATDLRDATKVTVRTEGFDFAPECIRVAPGTPVTFEVDFAAFPLIGGELGVPDPASPFGEVRHGHAATFRIFAPGVYGYYSDPWWRIRMYGAVIVE